MATIATRISMVSSLSLLLELTADDRQLQRFAGTVHLKPETGNLFLE